jgi:hypothetical protein
MRYEVIFSTRHQCGEYSFGDFVVSGLKITAQGNPNNNLESRRTYDGTNMATAI